MNITDILNQSYVNNTVNEYIIALIAFAATYLILKFLNYIVKYKVQKFTSKTKTDFDDELVKLFEVLGWPFYLIVSLYVASQFIQIPPSAITVFDYAIVLILTFYGILIIHYLIDYSRQKYLKRRKKDTKNTTNTMDTTILDFLVKIGKVILWAIAAVLFLSNMGYNVSGLIAGLGVGGLAIAFALQNVLSDVFSSISIYLDKPFQPGDFIAIGDDMGTVKKIGIKTTRLESLGGEELVMSNRELTSARINNYRKMKRRRISFEVGVKYDTSHAKLKKINSIVKDIFSNMDDAVLEMVYFKSFGDSSLVYEVIYYVETGDYYKYLETQEKVNLEIKKRFEKNNIEFAFPTRTIHMQKG